MRPVGRRLDSAAITGVWPQSPGAEPLVRGGAKPFVAEAFLVFKCSVEAANLPTLLKYVNAKKSDICVIFAKKTWVATKLGGPGLKLGGGCAPSPCLKPPLSNRQYSLIKFTRISKNCQ